MSLNQSSYISINSWRNCVNWREEMESETRWWRIISDLSSRTTDASWGLIFRWQRWRSCTSPVKHNQIIRTPSVMNYREIEWNLIKYTSLCNYPICFSFQEPDCTIKKTTSYTGEFGYEYYLFEITGMLVQIRCIYVLYISLYTYSIVSLLSVNNKLRPS